MSFIQHLEEFRTRLIVSLVTYLVACAVAWPKSPFLLARLLAPLGRPAVFLGPAEGFMVMLKVDMTAAAILASPVIIWQVMAFVLPALTRKERAAGIFIVMAGALSFLGGMLLGWLYLLPAMMKFFMGFGSEALVPMISADRYLSFALWILLGSGAAFELPIVTAGLAKVGIVTARGLLKGWRFATVACFVAGAAITPSPDAFSMIVVSLVLVALYIAGVGTAALAGRWG
jgi:sec-independent protein translocase protein TatC